MNFSIVRAVIIALTVVLAGCRTGVDVTRAADETWKISPSHSTEADVRQLFGNPQSVQTDSDYKHLFYSRENIHCSQWEGKGIDVAIVKQTGSVADISSWR